MIPCKISPCVNFQCGKMIKSNQPNKTKLLPKEKIDDAFIGKAFGDNVNTPQGSNYFVESEVNKGRNKSISKNH